MAKLLGGFLKKKTMNTIPFNVEMRTLAYVMIHNLYPMTNLTTLSEPRTIFLYDLYTHKEINICEHIYHLLTTSIIKRNSRTIIPFPSLIAKTRLKIPSGLTIVPRDYPIGANIVTRSKAHITRSKINISQILRDNVEEEGGDKEEEIDRFTSTRRALQSHLPKHKHGGPIALITLLLGQSRCMACSNPMCSTPQISLRISKARLLHYHHRLKT